MNQNLRASATLAGLALLCTGGPALAQSGPQIFQGQIQVVSATPLGSGNCGKVAKDDAYEVTLRIPAATPKHYKLQILSENFGLHLVKQSATEAAYTILNVDGTVGTGSVHIVAGGTVTLLGDGAYAELPITVKIPGQCEIAFFAVASAWSSL